MTNDLRSLSDDELLARTRELARHEQDLTIQVIAHLEEVARRRLFAARGYSSLFEYAVKALAYSEPAASQRVAAMRLARAVPEARDLLERGELKLTSAAAVERFIRREENETGRRLTAEVKSGIVKEVSGKSSRETERWLAARAVGAGMFPRSERARALTAEHTELRIVADAGLMARIDRVRELKGTHLAFAEIFAKALDAYLDREDPLRKRARKERSAEPVRATALGDPAVVALSGPTPAPQPLPAPEVRRGAGPDGVGEGREATRVRHGTNRGRYVPVGVRRAVAIRAGGRCEYLDAKTDRRCESRNALQWDHIRPFAHGGPATVANLRQLCPAHQQWAAIRNLGPRVMDRYLRVPVPR